MQVVCGSRHFLFRFMPLTKAQKQKIIEDLKEKIAGQKAMIFVDFTGLKVKDLTNLRKRLKGAGDETKVSSSPFANARVGDEIRVAKKTLIQLALKNTGIEIETKKIPGEIAIVFGYQDEISLAKILYQFSQEYPSLKILGGFFENKFVEAEKIIELAKLPTKKELLASLVGSISAPISNFVYVLEANIKGLIYVLAKAKT